MVPDPTDRTRPLTGPEETVLVDLLGASVEPEEQRIRESGLPRSTYQDAKARLYAAGLLEERYVPSPLALGIPRVSVLLTHPFAEQLQAEVERLERLSSTILLWSGTGTVLAVVFGPLPASADTSELTASTDVGAGRSIALELDARTPCWPVYFDFEGAYVRVGARKGNRRYPRHLPSGPPPGASRLSGGARELTRLVRRPFETEGPEGRAYPTRPASLPRSERRLLQRNCAEWRVFPNVSALPGPAGMRFSHVLLIHGTLRPQAGVDRLFHGLVAACGVSPFLLATDGAQVLVGGLAAASDPGAKRPEEPPRPRQPVLAELGTHLQGITISREEIGQLRVHVSHRYDRLLSA
jgi:hypothetical protein